MMLASSETPWSFRPRTDWLRPGCELFHRRAMLRSPFLRALLVAAVWPFSGSLVGCGGVGGEAEFPPTAKRWYDRGEKSYRAGDLEDAELAAENALRAAPEREET